MVSSLLSSTAKLKRIFRLVQAAGIAALVIGAALLTVGLFQLVAADGGFLSLIGVVLGTLVLMAGWRVTWMLVRVRASAGMLQAVMRKNAFDAAAERARRVN